MEASLKLGNGNWAVKEDSLLAYDDVGGKFRPLPFDFTRASSATVVNKQGLIETVGSGIPRIDFSNDVNGALLLEPQSTNLVTYSEDFSDASWVKLGSGSGSEPIVTSNSAISPDGTLNATRLQFNLGGGTTSTDRAFIRTSFTSQTDYYYSCYVKSNNGQEQKLLWQQGADSDEFTVTTEWQRVEFDRNGSAETFAGLSLRGGISTVDTADVLVWGFQVEQSSFATSYIPTQGAISTRLRDIANNSGIGSLIGQTEGSVFFDLNTTLKNYSVISISDGTNANRVVFYFSAVLNQIASYITKSNVNSSTISSIVNSYPNSNYKVVIKYNSIGFYIFANGGLIGTILSNYSFPNNTLNEIKLSSPDNSNFFEGKVKNIIVYNQSLTDSEAIALTTI